MKRKSNIAGKFVSSPSIAAVLSENFLRKLAGDAAYAQGVTDFNEGRVTKLQFHHGEIIYATVTGERAFIVDLAYYQKIQFYCDCHDNRTNGTFCRHGVAVGLAFLDEYRKPAVASEPSRDAAAGRDWEKLRSFLVNLGSPELTDFILEQARANDRLKFNLMTAASTGKNDLPIVAFKKIIDRALERYGRESARDYGSLLNRKRVSWEDKQRSAQATVALVGLLEQFIGQIRRYQNNKHLPEAMNGSEHLMIRLDTLAQHDSTIEQYFESVRKMYFDACAAFDPDPAAMAKRIFHLAILKGIDIGTDPTLHVDLFGEMGVAEYRSLVRKEWNSLLPSLPYYSPKPSFEVRERLRQAMEQIAADTGEIDVTIEIKEKFLFDARSYLDLAQFCADHGKEDRALAVAEKGWRAFHYLPGDPFRELLIDLYHSRGRYDDAMGLLWEDFATKPIADNYVAMHEYAVRVGDAGFRKRWKARALHDVRQMIRAMRRTPKKVRLASPYADFTEIVRIHLIDGDIDLAWDTALEGECSVSIWLDLANRRARNHPEDALAIYQALIEPEIEQRNMEAYQRAVEWIRESALLLKRLHRADEWELFVSDIRTKHRMKRKFIALLEETMEPRKKSLRGV